MENLNLKQSHEFSQVKEKKDYICKREHRDCTWLRGFPQVTAGKNHNAGLTKASADRKSEHKPHDRDTI